MNFRNFILKKHEFLEQIIFCVLLTVIIQLRRGKSGLFVTLLLTTKKMSSQHLHRFLENVPSLQKTRAAGTSQKQKP